MTAQPLGFSTPVVTTTDLCPVVVVGMGGAPRLREGKATPMGEATYSTGAVLLVQREGEVSPQKSASVHVIDAAPTYELGSRYRAEGRVYVMPYESNQRVAYSITVERLVPDTAPAQPQKRPGSES